MKVDASLKSLSMKLAGVICFASLALGTVTVVAAGESSEAFAFYIDYLKSSSQAQAMADISPFMPSWWRSRYESADAQTQVQAVTRARNLSESLQKVEWVKEEADSGGIRLHMTAREQNDFAMRGEVLLIKESGAFKIEESRWATEN